jgi:peptide deformylase
MKILKFPDPALFVTCVEVTVFGPELKVLLDSMWETMVEGKGMGLAANQVGLTFRMFTMLGPSEEKLYIVNPKILEKSKISANLQEGCLSAPGELLTLEERASWVKVKFQDETGKEHERVFKGIHSVCIQHETDHLEGKSHLQSKSLKSAKRKALAKKWGIKAK